ncbi:hypothetical protein BDR22DRAFT_895700 [Usnea florida]
MATDSASTNTAGYQRSNLASHPENILDVASSMARSTLSYKTNNKVSETDSGKSYSPVGNSTRSGLDTLLANSHSQLNQTPPAIEQPATSAGPTSPETQRTLGGLTASSAPIK